MQAEMLDSVVSSNLQELPNASSALKLFENPQFRVRVIMRCSEPWFVASDACDGLALSNVSKALADLDDDDKLKLTKDELDTLTSSEGIKCSVDSRVQSLNLVSESGLPEEIGHDLLVRLFRQYLKSKFPSWADSPTALQRETSGTMRTASRPICSQSDGFFFFPFACF